MTASEWFPGEGRNADDEAFLSELRACAEDRGLVDATPQDTSLHVWESALVALVAVPRLQEIPAQPTLEIVSDLRRGPDLMCGWETDGYLTDSCDPLDLTGVEPTPRALARHAFGWFEAELRRPVERVTWRTWRGERSLVRYADTREPVWGHLSRRLRDRHPVSVVRLR